MGYISTCLAKCQLFNYHRINVKKGHPRKGFNFLDFACYIGKFYKVYGRGIEQQKKA